MDRVVVPAELARVAVIRVIFDESGSRIELDLRLQTMAHPEEFEPPTF
jgi:hypothetical protein